eukprot:9916003-Alexandrium_andersonii.AAC.1
MLLGTARPQAGALPTGAGRQAVSLEGVEWYEGMTGRSQRAASRAATGERSHCATGLQQQTLPRART